MSISLSGRALEALTVEADRERIRHMNILKLCMGAIMRKAELSKVTLTRADISEMASSRYEIRFTVQSDNTVEIEMRDFEPNLT